MNCRCLIVTARTVGEFRCISFHVWTYFFVVHHATGTATDKIKSLWITIRTQLFQRQTTITIFPPANRHCITVHKNNLNICLRINGFFFWKINLLSYLPPIAWKVVRWLKCWCCSPVDWGSYYSPMGMLLGAFIRSPCLDMNPYQHVRIKRRYENGSVTRPPRWLYRFGCCHQEKEFGWSDRVWVIELLYYSLAHCLWQLQQHN